MYTGITCASLSRSGNFEVAITEKLISFDSGSDMLALHAFMDFAEIPSIPMTFWARFLDDSFYTFRGDWFEVE